MNVALQVAEQIQADDIVLVDDDMLVSEFMRRVLKGSGRRVRDFTDPVVALAYLENHSAQCLIVDTRMPSMSGTELLEELLELPHLGTTRMILCSASRRTQALSGTSARERVEQISKDDLLDRSTLLQRLGGPSANRQVSELRVVPATSTGVKGG